MYQVTAKVISNNQILGELKRRRDIPRIRPRDIAGNWLMWLKAPEIAREAKPGQFVMVRCDDCTLPRPLSIHQVDNEGNIALFYAVWEDGRGTPWLSWRRPGDVLDISGPLGNGFTMNPGSRNLLLVAGGVGIAPQLFLAREAVQNNLKVKLLYGVSGEARSEKEPNPSQLYPLKRLHESIEVETIITNAHGTQNMVLDLLTQDKINWADQIFACGPQAMYREMAANYGQLLKDRPVQVSLEIRMGCGYGVCYGCTVKTKNGLKQVCKDGPVFNLNDILWDEPIC